MVPEITAKIQNKLLSVGGGGRISKDTICTLSLQSYDRKYLKFIQAKYNTQTFITSLLERTFVWKEILEG